MAAEERLGLVARTFNSRAAAKVEEYAQVLACGRVAPRLQQCKHNRCKQDQSCSTLLGKMEAKAWCLSRLISKRFQTPQAPLRAQ